MSDLPAALEKFEAEEKQFILALQNFVASSNGIKDALDRRSKQIDDEYGMISQKVSAILLRAKNELTDTTKHVESVADKVEQLRKEDTISMSKSQLQSQIVSGGSDALVRNWDIKTGKCSSTLKGHTGIVNCITSYPDGTLVTGSNDKTIKLWKDGECINTLTGHKLHVQCLTVKKNGILASGSGDKTVRLWTKEGECTGVLSAERVIYNVFELKDGNLAGAAEKSIVVWDVDVQSTINELKHDAVVLCGIALADGTIAGGYNDGMVRIWNPSSGEIVKTLESEDKKKLQCLLELQDGMIVGGYISGEIKVWNVSTGDCVREFSGHTNSIHSLIELENGMIASASRDGTIRVWNINKGVCIKNMRHEGRGETYATSLHRVV
jgi:WD40 repeat protein